MRFPGSIAAVRAPALLLLACIAAPAAPAAAQGGYTTERHGQAGLDFPVPRRYSPMPVQPNERWIRFKYVEDIEHARRRENRVRPELMIVDIPWIPDPAALTGGTLTERDGGDGGGDGEGEGDGGPQPASGRDAAPAAKVPEPPVNTFERFLERRLSGWSATDPKPDRVRRDWESSVYLLEHRASERTGRRGWAFVWRQADAREVALVGICHADDFDEQVRIWRHIAGEIKIYEPKDAERERLERFYSRRAFSDPDYRIRVRLRLPKGWQSEDTDNYIVVYNTPDQPLVRKIVRDLEYLREEYVKLFPPAGEIEAVSTVRVCADRDEYLAFSGLPGTAGYWNHVTEELVLYDATIKEKGRPTDKSNTFIILYHEAFHQYIHYSAGELAPHPWFNEGYGDFFSGAQISGGRVRRIGPNPWRVATIQRAVEQGKHVPWPEILRYEQKDYYANPAICYAQGWSMVYFLNTSRDVQRDERLSRILPLYFETLKVAWADELARLEAAGEEEEPEKRHEAQVRARMAAHEAAFEGVDVEALEEAWKHFVAELVDPAGR